MQKPFDLSVYFVADPALCGERAMIDVVMKAVSGGVTLVQYRNKSGNMPALIAEAALLCELLRPFNIPLLINDYPEVAFAIGAAGVHLGQGDVSAADARRRLGPDAIIGQTAFTVEQIKALDAAVDYIGTGPVYVTKTDKGKPVLGPENFAELVKISPVPVVGIGGMTPQNSAAVIRAGAQGVAMMRALSEAPDPMQAAREFVFAVQIAREEGCV